MPFGRLLRQWRTTRGLSQLALATEAGISTRHLSFLETGRAQPSREMVQLLAGMLGVPAADRNALLVCAGYAPVTSDDPVDPAQLEPVQRALELILRQQDPYPALVLDGQSNILELNRGARCTFGMFFEPGCKQVNATKTIFDPNGLRPYITNWDHLARGAIQALQREVASTGSPSLMQLRDELLEYPGVPSRWRTLDPAAPEPPFGTMHLRKGDLSLAFFSTQTRLVTPPSAALQQVRIKLFFPADAVTESFARRILPAA
jgi:transcriptional regulator with XRE-family HTH domain